MEASTVLLLSAATAAAGSLVSGIAQSSQSRREVAVDNTNADIAQEQAASESEAIREKAQRLRGQQIAAAGASGVALDGSSFVDAMADSAINAELDALNAEYSGKLQSWNYRAQAKAAQESQNGALVEGIFGAGSKALSAYGAWLQS